MNEDLSTGLARENWQKIMILDRILRPTQEHQGEALSVCDLIPAVPARDLTRAW